MVRLGIIGAGIMGAKVARAVAGLPDVTLTAVADVDLERANRLAHTADVGSTGRVVPTAVAGDAGGSGRVAPTAVAGDAGGSGREAPTAVAGDAGRSGRVAVPPGVTAFADYRELIESGLVDAVYIGLPHSGHAGACVAAAEQRLHLLVDKPLCNTVEEAEQIVEARDRAGIVVMVGFSYRFRAEWRLAQRFVADGVIGVPGFVSDVIAEASAHTPAWYWDAGAGGGILQLQAHHCFDRLTWLLGSPLTEVTCRTHSTPGQAESAATITAAFASGAVAGISLGFGRAYSADERALTLVQGSVGQLQIDQTRTISTRTAQGGTTEAYADDDWLTRQLSQFIDSCQGARPAYPTAEDGLRALVSAAAAAESARTGRTVSLR